MVGRVADKVAIVVGGGQTPGEAVAHQADVTDETSVKAMIQKAVGAASASFGSHD